MRVPAGVAEAGAHHRAGDEAAGDRAVSLACADLVLVLCTSLPLAAAAQVQPAAQQTPDAAAKVANATSAAPASISAGAAVMDWPAAPGWEFTTLRAGNNGWVCMPDHPATQGNDPMCLDDAFRTWAEAWQAKTTPQISRIGIGYMVVGTSEGSNTDPYATSPTADNEWGSDGPHVMLVVPDISVLEGLPTTRESGGPYVMWRGTPYAHVMIPLEKKP